MRPLTRSCCSHFRSGSLPLSRGAIRQLLRPSSPKTLYSPLPFWLVRRNHDAADASAASAHVHSQKADAIVVGGGAAGIAVVGNLLEVIPDGKIVWIDRAFEGGAIGQLYRELPSYSPAGDYLQYALNLRTFRDICDAAPQPNVFTALKDLDLDMTCPLYYAADLLTLISDGLIQHPRIEPILGNVTRAVRNPSTRNWRITLTPNHDLGEPPLSIHYTAPLVVYCTGSRPRATDLPIHLSRLTLETCLSPSRLARLLPTSEPRTVAVVGSGHAAVLALRNLFRLAAVSHRQLRIRWFTRTASLTYAAFRDDDGALLHEHDGLMGEAARFAKTMLEGERLATSGAGAYITRFVLPQVDEKEAAGMSEKAREIMEGDAMRPHLEGVDYVVQCIGFERARLPEVRPGLGPLAGPVGTARRLVFNGLTGSLFPSSGSRNEVLGLFGAGSAFPELELAVEGWRQPAVGVWKFMRFVHKMVPRWVTATKVGRFTRAEDRDLEEGRRRYHEYY
ncbi:pyridine nucleotide-disulfide oxidoreductase-domain-containing protein [Parachaetomium inaequale]|uniref:Pyridine nucleotide-disulfide oxidoreductase-domain-containing protein n=1 Tax=Parachaetomium inaequale TaxID=2588326 RepID=A0AAN6PBY3_9PEZI|nr:pyridine nucleotide-disulfide oxidoreductase-domain-containing protein [Parachaetomium inaequale]